MGIPRVSVTIISFNQCQYLRECLESAVHQNYENFEIVVRDDASTDGSRGLIEEYARNYPHLIRPHFAAKNGGLAANRDAAQRATTGVYIAWLDADDVALSNRLSEQVRFLEASTECSLAYSNLQVLRGAELTDELVYGSHRPPVRSGDHRTLLQEENFIISSSLMYRAGSLPDRGYHQPFGRTFSDWHFLVRLASVGRIGYIDKALGMYRRHPAAATAYAKGVGSGVRQRRAQALWAMRKEFTQDTPLIDYCVSRFYISQLAGSIRQRSLRMAMHSLLTLAARPTSTVRAVNDRRRKKNLLPSFE